LNITPAVADWRRRNEIEGNMATRRQILIGAAAAVGLYRFFYRVPRVDAATFEISHTDDEWQKLLTPAQYDVLRRSGHYGPRVHAPDDADEQTKLIAFTGRDPGEPRNPSP
jgi:peptide-methionine (R)-S-oxide reductase